MPDSTSERREDGPLTADADRHLSERLDDILGEFGPVRARVSFAISDWLASRLDAERAARAPEGDGPGVLADAMYEDGCLTPPRTDHADHVVAALAQNGYEIASLRAARAEPGRDWAEGVVADLLGVESALTEAQERLRKALTLASGAAALEAHGEPQEGERPETPQAIRNAFRAEILDGMRDAGEDPEEIAYVSENLGLLAAPPQAAFSQNPDVPWLDKTLHYPAAASRPQAPEVEG